MAEEAQDRAITTLINPRFRRLEPIIKKLEIETIDYALPATLMALAVALLWWNQLLISASQGVICLVYKIC